MIEQPLPRSAPEAQGVPSSAIVDFVDAAEQGGFELNSLMVVRHGHVVAEGWWTPYRPEIPHQLFSLSKSFTSTAAGLAISEGYFSLDDAVVSFFPEQAPANVSENLTAMRVRHLLSMSTGHAENTIGPLKRRTYGDDWVSWFLAAPVEYAPGTHFLYNTGATYMVSAILQKTTGTRLLDFLQPRLFAPLGIVGITSETCPRGMHVGGWGMMARTEDIAKFGLLYLQDGLWKGRRLLPEGWVREATAKQIDNAPPLLGNIPNTPASDNDWEQGYGYQFWRCRHDCYRGDGAFGQYCLVIPHKQAVVAITAGMSGMGAVLDQVWQHLLPALSQAQLPEDRAGEARMRQRLAELALRTVSGERESPCAPRVSCHAYEFSDNALGLQRITVDFSGRAPRITMRDSAGEHAFACGYGEWVLGEWARPYEAYGCPATPAVGASGAWISDDNYQVRACFYETPFIETMTLQFAGEELIFDLRANVGFAPTERPRLVGQRV